MTPPKTLLPRALPVACALVALAILVHAYLLLALRGYPYEAWDEIPASNVAAVLDFSERNRVYTYGSLDTALHALSQFAVSHFTASGRTLVRHSFSNAVLPSLDNPDLAQGEKTWAGPDYAWFRGFNSRDSIFVARELYAAVIFALGCLLGGLAIWLLGAQAPPLLVSTLFLLATPLFVGQACQAVPNAINCLLVTASFLVAIVAVLQARPRMFAVAAILFPLALNMKIDVAPFGLFLAAAYAATLFLAQASLRAAMVLSAKLLAIFALAFVASRPGMLVDPAGELSGQMRMFSILAPEVGTPELRFAVFQKTLDDFVFSVMGSGLPAPWGLVIASAAVALFLWLLAMQNDLSPARRRWAGLLVLLALAILWATPILTAVKPYPRYFLNGAGVVSVLLGLSTVFALRRGNVARRRAGLALAAVLGGVALANVADAYARGRKLAEALARNEGLDPAYSRNRASLEMVRWIRQGRYLPEVLVDQHSYTDLGVFANNGIKATYVNVLNYAQVLRDVSRPTLVLYVPASGYRRQDPRWAENRRWRSRDVDWTGYEAALGSLRKRLELRGGIMDSFSIAPVDPLDGVVVAEAGAKRPPSSAPR